MPDLETPAADRSSLLRRLLRPRARRVDMLIAVLLATLGFGLAVQVRSTQHVGLLATARPEDLVQILDELNSRSDQLRAEIASLTATQERLTSGTGAASTALSEAKRRAQVLGVIAGTLPASGPGVRVTITDPNGQVGSSVLLDAMEELRNAGAEAMQVQALAPDGTSHAVRLVASSAFVDTSGGVLVDGQMLTAPYAFLAIGDPGTLAGAMAIPGGVSDTVQHAGGTTQVTRSALLHVAALHPLVAPRYARPR